VSTLRGTKTESHTREEKKKKVEPVKRMVPEQYLVVKGLTSGLRMEGESGERNRRGSTKEKNQWFAKEGPPWKRTLLMGVRWGFRKKLRSGVWGAA